MKTYALVVLALALGACGKLPDSPTPTDFNVGDLSIPVSFTTLYEGYLSSCASCHAPGATGDMTGIERTLDFTTRTTAYASSFNAEASGLSGNLAACNSAPLVAPFAPGSSLVLAVLGASWAASYSGPPGCDHTVITDEGTKTTMAMPAGFAASLSAWIGQGALDN